MQLTVKVREGSTKGDLKQIRREGNVPAIIYASNRQPEKLIIDGTELGAILRGVLPGQLPTTVFTLQDDKGSRRAIIKDIQYQLTTYKISHLDFEELVEDVPVSIKVPVNCTKIADCIGVKLGGFLRQVRRHVKVECLPKHIPAEFLVDVHDLGIRQSKRLKDVQIPQNVRPLVSADEVLVVVAKR